MDKTIPLPAARILDLIGSIEAPKGYDTLYGNNQDKVAFRLTTLTLDNVIASGPTWTKKYKSSACGRYQFMNDTLKDLKKTEKLTGNEVFSPDLQDRLAFALLKRRGYSQWINGVISHDDFMIGLAKEWASFPVPYAMQGRHRKVKRGETYYAGDALNKALVTPEVVWLCLRDAYEGRMIPTAQEPVVAQPVPAPVTKPDQTLSFWQRVLVAFAGFFKREA